MSFGLFKRAYHLQAELLWCGDVMGLCQMCLLLMGNACGLQLFDDGFVSFGCCKSCVTLKFQDKSHLILNIIQVSDPKLNTLIACLAEGDGPEFGHLPDFFSFISPSPKFGSISASLISSPIAFKLHPSTDMGRTGVPPSVVTRCSAWW